MCNLNHIIKLQDTNLHTPLMRFFDFLPGIYEDQEEFHFSTRFPIISEVKTCHFFVIFGLYEFQPFSLAFLTSKW